MTYENDPCDNAFESIEDVKHHNMSITSKPELEPVYIVDWEEDPGAPVVLKVEIAQVINRGNLSDEGLKDYIGVLLAEACGNSGYNMVFAKDEASALQAVKDAAK